VRSIVAERARAHGVPVGFALAIAQVETGNRCHMRGRAGEQGVMQVKPATARGVGVRGNLYDCHVGAEAGVRYARQAISMYGVSCAAASAYNRGLYARPVCSSYGRRVLRLASR